MKINYLNLLLCGSLAITISSCGDGSNADDAANQDSTAVDTTQMWGFESMEGNSYQVPSPNELFALIKESKLPYKDGLITTESMLYTDSKVQALNFGRLTADIAYTASYEKFQESMSNFENLRKVGNDLGISYVFDELMVNRVKTNMSNADSLEVISNESYQRIITQLEQGEKGSTLAIIATGGFVESIYILSNLIGDYKEGSTLVQRLADQKLVMENILDYLNLYSDEDRVQEVLNEIQSFSDIYLKLDEEKISNEMTEESGHVVLGGSRIIMTKEEFNQLKAAATTYRNSFSKPTEG